MTKTFLMCPADYFDVSYDINCHMTDQMGKVDVKLARQQWLSLHAQVSGLANVKLIDPVRGLPDMVFTANAGLPLREYYIKKTIIVSNFLNAERKREADLFRDWFVEAGYNTIAASGDDIIFEGAGDGLYDTNNTCWIGQGFRTNWAGVNLVFDFVDAISNQVLKLKDPRFYHLDTCFCPLDNGYFLAFPGAFEPGALSMFGDKLITVSEEDAVKFACNAISIGNVVILPNCSDGLCDRLADVGLSTIRVDMSEFLKSGGACKCLVLEI